MSAIPGYVTSPVLAGVTISTGNSNRDGSTGSYSTLYTPTSKSGARIDKITVTAQGNTTAGMVRVFINDGSTVRLYAEIAVTLATPSASVQAFTGSITFSTGLFIPNGTSLKLSTANSETFSCFCHGGEL